MDHLSEQTDCGVCDYYIDAAEVGSDDWYGALDYNKVNDTTNITVSSSGLKTLKFQLDGKNASASDYNFRMQRAWLWRTA